LDAVMDAENHRTIFVCDPTDRSRQLQEILNDVEDKSMLVGDIFHKKEVQQDWEKRFGGTAAITGGSSAVTCIRNGIPIFAAIVNYITQQLFLSCSAGNFYVHLPIDGRKIDQVDFDYVVTHGRRLYFHDLDHTDVRRYVTFTGKSGYRENLADSQLMPEDEIDRLRAYDIPGGPLRILYLSDHWPENHPIGFILANGEKITEWIHWLPFVRNARKRLDDSEAALRLYEVFQARPYTKETVLMSTGPSYSIFKPISRLDNRVRLNVSRLSEFPNPSHFRSTLIVTPYDNDWVGRVVRQNGYRPIVMY
jgi:hypothetical protein